MARGKDGEDAKGAAPGRDAESVWVVAQRVCGGREEGTSTELTRIAHTRGGLRRVWFRLRMEETRRPFEPHGKQAAALQNGRHGDCVPPEGVLKSEESAEL